MTIDLGPFVSPPRLRGTVFLDQVARDSWCSPGTVVTETDLPPGATYYPGGRWPGHTMTCPSGALLAVANDPDEAVALLRASGRVLVAFADGDL